MISYSSIQETQSSTLEPTAVTNRWDKYASTKRKTNRPASFSICVIPLSRPLVSSWSSQKCLCPRPTSSTFPPYRSCPVSSFLPALPLQAVSLLPVLSFHRQIIVNTVCCDRAKNLQTDPLFFLDWNVGTTFRPAQQVLDMFIGSGLEAEVDEK